MTKLRLGPLLDEKPVKVTLVLSASTVRDLKDYAAVHAKQNGLSTPLPIDRMIGPMVERFIATDRGL